MSRTSPNKRNAGNGFTLAKQTALYQQHLDKVYCDVVIKIKDEEFFVHACIVAASCPKLQRLIEEKKVYVDTPNRPAVEVELSESVFSPKVFEFILTYMYLGVLDWGKVAPDLVNQVLDVAHWCEFNQLIDDYMSFNQEEEQDDSIGGSTIIMVDTCDDSGQEDIEEENEEEEDIDEDRESDGEQTNSYEESALTDHQEALYCMLCGVQFNIGDEISLAEHMKIHEDSNEQMSSRRGVARRKASLGLKKKYKSLIPNYKEEEEETVNYENDYNHKKHIEKKPLRSSKKWGKVSLFKKEYICGLCNKKMTSQKSLTTHMRSLCPLREQNEEYVESMSTEEIATQLLSELANEEPGSNVLRSTKGLTVQTGTYVRSYVKKQEGKGKRTIKMEKKIKTAKLWICPQCPDYVFERKRDQIMHIRSVHGVIKRHICDQCGKSLDGRTALALHMRIHTGERPFVCPTCGRGFSERKTMEDHTRRHTGERPFLCTICGKDFTYRQSLYRHMKFHSGERPYQCQVCGKTFVLKQNLQEHVVRHEKHELLKCTQCKAQFANKDILLKHQLEAHLISNENGIEIQEVHPHHVIDIAPVSDVTTSVASYEMTIDNRMLDSYAE